MRWLVVVLLVGTGRAMGDGGLVRLEHELAEGRLVVLTAPTPAVAGVVDVTVLAPEGVEVEAVVSAWDAWIAPEGWQRLEGNRWGHPEGVGMLVDIEAGEWRVWLRVLAGEGEQGEGRVMSFPLTVGEQSTWSDAWPWLLPLAAIGLATAARRKA
jgi:hypothetical protein